MGTGFGYRRLERWIGEAWLRGQPGTDFAEFRKRTGLNSRGQLKAFPSPDPENLELIDRPFDDPTLKGKVSVPCRLVR